MADSDEELEFNPTEKEVQRVTCVCGSPITESELLQCSSADCTQQWYHRECVFGPAADTAGSAASSSVDPFANEYENWICDMCVMQAAEQKTGSDSAQLPSTSQKKDKPENSGGVHQDTNTNSGIKHKTKKKKTTIRRPKSKLSKDNVMVDSAARIIQILQEVEQQPQFQSRHGYAKEVVAISKQLLAQKSHQTFQSVCSNMTDKLWDVLTAGDKLPMGAQANGAMWAKFHLLRLSDEVDAMWESLFTDIGLQSKNIVKKLLCQYVLESVLYVMIKQRDDVDKNEVVTEKSLYTEHDEQVLRYVSGYIPFALLKRYRRSRHERATIYVEFLSAWKVQNDNKTISTSLLTYTTTWINIQNRGGLFEVNDDVYRLFRCMEHSSRQVLITDNLSALKQIDVKDKLKQNVMQNHHVQVMWSKLVAGATGKVNWAPLFESIVNYWIKIRLHAFAQMYIELRKNTTLVTKKGEKSLRKELK